VTASINKILRRDADTQGIDFEKYDLLGCNKVKFLRKPAVSKGHTASIFRLSLA
jgi:hypothetical protein